MSSKMLTFLIILPKPVTKPSHHQIPPCLSQVCNGQQNGESHPTLKIKTKAHDESRYKKFSLTPD